MSPGSMIADVSTGVTMQIRLGACAGISSTIAYQLSRAYDCARSEVAPYAWSVRCIAEHTR
eukprot:3940724-Rhodomonas_salina.1